MGFFRTFNAAIAQNKYYLAVNILYKYYVYIIDYNKLV